MKKLSIVIASLLLFGLSSCGVGGKKIFGGVIPASDPVVIEEKETEHNNISLLSKGSSLKLCMVAENAADCYPRFAPTMEWDTAAGNAIINAAGGIVIDQTTQEKMKYNKENLLNNWFLAQLN